MIPTVDGRNPAPADMVISHYLRGFIHVRWCRISSINSMSCKILGMSCLTGGVNECCFFFSFSDRWRYWFLSSRWWRRSTNGQSWIISLRWTFETHHLECQQRLNQKQQWRSNWGDFSPNISRGYFIYFTPCISSYWPTLYSWFSKWKLI